MTCPHCQAGFLPEGARRCPLCGQLRSGSQTAVSVDVAPADQTPAEDYSAADDLVTAQLGTLFRIERPLKRGRVIFGNVVPWNQVWRTGANAATMFITDKDLIFGSTVVPAGKYTLWTLPTPTGAKLIINSETGQWGTDYHADKDFARLDVASRQVSPPVDQFVIAVAPQGSGGLLRYSWDDREFSIPFTVK